MDAPVHQVTVTQIKIGDSCCYLKTCGHVGDNVGELPSCSEFAFLKRSEDTTTGHSSSANVGQYFSVASPRTNYSLPVLIICLCLVLGDPQNGFPSRPFTRQPKGGSPTRQTQKDCTQSSSPVQRQVSEHVAGANEAAAPAPAAAKNASKAKEMP